ncbi:MAG TPA: 5'/3'-nucleotidase SurE [Chitinophagales bacterium]|nr:5'/3'-nucleotidase SurE [Chitinophagales bacterium]HRK26541.1 5'/3'-nucleotidase SurE [Chitinophagales bacterium]
MFSKDRVILVTNDDGITSGGIRALVEVMQEFGTVIVVAPDKPQSAMGHAITIHFPIRLAKVDIFDDVEAYACSGTPVDCVKLAVDKILHRKPDLCVSGINHGANSSINVIYSGTLSAAMEASLEKIPAIGFSLLNYSSKADMEPCKKYVRNITRQMLTNGVPNYHLLNVNIPNLPQNEIKGIKICRQAKARWEESFEQRKDPMGGTYYWLTGQFINLDPGEDTDIYALDNGYVSVVPVQHDLTAYEDIDFLKTNWQL